MERTRLRELTHFISAACSLAHATVEMERTRLRELTHHYQPENPPTPLL